jgi:hypothetical protein
MKTRDKTAFAEDFLDKVVARRSVGFH